MKNQTIRIAWLMSMLLVLSTFFSGIRAQTVTSRYTSMTPNTNAYMEYLPQGYSATGSATYPLIISIHGTGELGPGTTATLPKVNNNAIFKVIKNGLFPTSFKVQGKDYKFIVIAPQFVGWPDGVQIGKIIDYAVAHYKVDRTRIYITGLSMGGGVTWETASLPANIGRIAAIVPICGASYPTTAKARLIATNNLPVWALHNSGDPTVSVENTNAWIRDINLAPAPNPQARKTIFAVGGHDAWSKTFDPTYKEEGKNVYEWMLQFTTTRLGASSNAAPVVNAGGDQTLTLPTASVQLSGTATDADGSIKSYAWTKVSGPSSLTIVSASSASTVISSLVAGTYILRLTATDNKGATAYDEVKVLVNPAPVTSTGTLSANAGADVTITLPANSIQMAGKATVPTGSTVASYTWLKTAGGPDQFKISSTTIANPVISNLVAGTYKFRFVVRDSKGNRIHDDVIITVGAAGTGTSAKYIQVNVYGGTDAYANAQWNNWNIGTGVKTNVASSAFKYTDGSASTVKANLSQSTEVVDNGNTYPGGMAPKEVLRYSSYSVEDRSLTLTGLTAGKKYDIEFYASRIQNPGNSTSFVIGSLKKAIETLTNYTNKAKFTGLTPDASGKIVITIAKSNAYNYLNGFSLTEGSSASTASVARSAESEGEVAADEIEALPASTVGRTAIKFDNQLTGKFDVTVTDLEGNVVKETVINKNQAGVSQSYISLDGLKAGTYIVIATREHYTEAILINKL